MDSGTQLLMALSRTMTPVTLGRNVVVLEEQVQGVGSGESSEAVDGGHRIHPADEQRQPLPGHGVGPHEVRGRAEVQELGSCRNALRRQAVPPAGRQVDGAVGDPPHDAVGQQVTQVSVVRGVRLAQDERQIRPSTKGIRLKGSSNSFVGQ